LVLAFSSSSFWIGNGVVLEPSSFLESSSFLKLLSYWMNILIKFLSGWEALEEFLFFFLKLYFLTDWAHLFVCLFLQWGDGSQGLMHAEQAFCLWVILQSYLLFLESPPSLSLSLFALLPPFFIYSISILFVFFSVPFKNFHLANA
jgi:hypothetical protein